MCFDVILVTPETVRLPSRADRLKKKARHPAPKKKKASARTSAKPQPGS